MPVMERLVYLRNHPILGRAAREFMLLYGLDIPPQVSLDDGFRMQHRGGVPARRLGERAE